MIAKLKHSNYLLLPLLLAALASCTYTRIPSKLWLSRAGDTLTVALDPQAEARWNPESDSLVVVCQGCEADRGTVVEHFNEQTYSRYEIAHTQGLSLTLYSMGHKDTVFVMAGEGIRDTTTPLPTIRRIPRRRTSHDAADNSNDASSTPKKVKVKDTPKDVVKETPKDAPKETPKDPVEEKKTVIKPTMLKVTATEGVAIYKDKSKKEVLRILPLGTALQLISREGDMYSVAVGDGEGFVEAEAVQLQ